MKNIDIVFITVMFALMLFEIITPGRQLKPPGIFATQEERMNWKPGPMFWVTGIVIGVYLLLKK